jgi:hypothetical protein
VNGIRVQEKLAPGQPGTKRYLDMYGGRVACVRNRADETQHRRYTTVELVVDKGVPNAATPPPLSVLAPSMQDIALVRIAYEEEALRPRSRRPVVDGTKMPALGRCPMAKWSNSAWLTGLPGLSAKMPNTGYA